MHTVRTTLAALALLLCAAPAFAQDPSGVDQRLQEAYELMVKGSKQVADPATKAQGVATYERACELYVGILGDVQSLPPQARDQVAQLCHYNTACARSLQGRSTEALDALEKAFESGWEDFEHTAQDPDLNPIRNLPRYAKVISEGQRILDARATREAKASMQGGKLFDYDFEVTTLDGKQVKLADLRGKVVIVDFWGTWCPPCRKEIPHFVELKKQFGDRLEIVGMTWEQGAMGPQAEAKVRAFAQQTGINYPLAMAGQAELRKVPGLEAFPTTLFIDKGGRVRHRAVGYHPERVLKAYVNALAEEPTPAPVEKKKPKSDYF